MVEISFKTERNHPVAESTATTTIEETKAIEFADRVMAEYYEIEKNIFKLNSIEATQFLVDTLERVIADLESDRVREVG